MLPGCYNRYNRNSTSYSGYANNKGYVSNYFHPIPAAYDSCNSRAGYRDNGVHVHRVHYSGYAMLCPSITIVGLVAMVG